MNIAKPTPYIVTITDRQDAHLPFVQQHLDSPMIVLDPQAIIEGVDLSFTLDNKRMIVTYDGTRLDTVSGVWYRKPRDIVPEQLHVTEDLAMYAITALQSHTVQVVTAFADATWASDYHAMRRAGSKSLQLEVAAQIGFHTPRTVMTSDPQAARQFVESEGECVVKTQYAYSPVPKGVAKSFLTKKISKKRMPELKNLHLAPAIFQQYIDAAFDVRVTVVGEKVFPAIIKVAADDSDVRDWRMGHYSGGMTIEPYKNFPQDVADLCVKLNKKLGLNFGAIDLVMDKHNTLWFLENNPNGQWGFIERQAGLPIGKALAELLRKGNVKKIGEHYAKPGRNTTII